MLKRARRFGRDQDGAVTVDWVVLTVALVGIALAVLSLVGGGVDDRADVLSTQIPQAATW